MASEPVRKAQNPDFLIGALFFTAAFIGLFAALTVIVVPEVLGGRLVATDSYMRLVRLERLLEGTGWYDSSIPRANLGFLLTGKTGVAGWFQGVDAFYHPVFVNAGLATALFLWPSESRLATPLRVAGAAFVAVLVLFGNIVEYRIWFELVRRCLSPPSTTSAAWSAYTTCATSFGAACSSPG